MNILFVSNLFPSEDEPVRGLDNATLLPHLRDCVKSEVWAVGLRPSLNPAKWGLRKDLSPRKEDLPFDPAFIGCPYIPKIGSRWNHRLMLRALRGPLSRLKEKFPVDVVLASWLYPDGCAAGAWADAAGIPYVMICQGSDAHSYLDNRFRRRAIVEAVTKSGGVITRSEDLARRLGNASCPKSLLHPIYNGVDTELFHPGDRAEMRRKLDLPTKGPILLFVGNFLEVKNPLLLVRSWRESLNLSDSTLIMLGSGPLESQIRSEAGEAHLLLPGRLPPHRVAEYMRAADLLCLSSHNEGVPNVILEAWASGIPVLSTDVGGISEVLCRPELGKLVPPDDQEAYANSLKELLADEPRHDSIRTYARQFSWPKVAQAYSEILQSALA